MYTTKDVSVKGEPLKEAMRFFQGFPLFFSAARSKYARLLHHAYFPTPVPIPVSHMPYRGLCYLNALPVMHLYKATGFLTEHGSSDYKLQTNRVDWKIPPTTSYYSVSASSGLTQRLAKEYRDWRITLPHVDQPWNSLAPGDKLLLAQVISNTPPSILGKDQSLFLDPSTGNVTNKPSEDDVELPGWVNLSSVNDQRVRVRDLEPNPNHEFWDYAGLYLWRGVRKKMKPTDAVTLGNFISRYMVGGTWHNLTILFDPNIRMEEDFFYLKPLYAGDPYSVILFALHHGIIPPEVWEKDFQLDKRLMTWDWDQYEQRRRELVTAVNPRLNHMMETLYAKRPSTLPPRRGRYRSGYDHGLRQRSKLYRDMRNKTG